MAYKMLDISKWQGTFDADIAKQNGIHTVVARCAYATKTDDKWKDFSSSIVSAGLNLGCFGFLNAHYLVANGGDIEIARTHMNNQVNHWISLAKESKVNSWFSIDQELESGQEMGLNKSDNTTILIEACDKVEKAGFYPCVYCSAAWAMQYIDLERFKYPLWIAYYYKNGTELDFSNSSASFPPGTYGQFLASLGTKLVAWQFTSEGYGDKYGVASEDLDKSWLYRYPVEEDEPEQPSLEKGSIIITGLNEADSMIVKGFALKFGGKVVEFN